MGVSRGTLNFDSAHLADAVALFGATKKSPLCVLTIIFLPAILKKWRGF